jgi:uncharacterized protein
MNESQDQDANAQVIAPQTSPAPVTAHDRSLSLDVLRGFALLGILTMNVVSFAMHEAAYMNPLYKGPFADSWQGSLDRVAYIVQAVFCDQRFMTIFAMLFGVGIATMSTRAEQAGSRNGKAHSSTTQHYRRAALLIGLGLLHAYALWYGDILLLYGLCALWVYPMRRLPTVTLIVIATLVLIVPIFIMGALGGLIWWWFEAEVSEVAQLVAQGQELSAAQAATWSQWLQAQDQWQPTPEALARDTALATGSISDWWVRNAKLSLFMQFLMFPMWGLWRATALMMLGIVLFRAGVWSGAMSNTALRRMMWIGLGVGLPLAVFAVWDALSHGMLVHRAYAITMNVQYVASVAMAFGYIGCVVLLTRKFATSTSGVMHTLLQSFAVIGRTSLSNYLLQTLIMTLLFSGLGFKLFERFPRWQLLVCVPIVWTVQVLLSRWWLSRYRSGPMETLTRKIIYA